jgi:hypothetical protein
MRATRERGGNLSPAAARGPIDSHVADRGEPNGGPPLGAGVNCLVARVSFVASHTFDAAGCRPPNAARNCFLKD